MLWYSTTVGVPSDTPERAEPAPEPEPEPPEPEPEPDVDGGGVDGARSGESEVVMSMVVVGVVLCLWTYVDVRFRRGAGAPLSRGFELWGGRE